MRRRRQLICIAALAAVAVGGCGAPRPSVTLPPDSAPPDVVLRAYLKAVHESDCATSRALMSPGATDLCGRVRIVAYRLENGPTRVSGQVEYATIVTTVGGDMTLADGDHTMFWILEQRPDGAWRVTSGGTGP